MYKRQEEVADFIYRFGSLQNNLRDPEQFPCVDYVSNDYAIFYTPLNEALPVSLERYPYYSLSLIHISSADPFLHTVCAL